MDPSRQVLLQLRWLVGYVGEQAQLGWWPTSFFGQYSLRALEYVAPKTAVLAQYHGVVEAARKLHDEHVSVGSYHLFRLPEIVEQDLHNLVLMPEGLELARQMPLIQSTALDALSSLAGDASLKGFGPVVVGRIEELGQAATLKAIAAGYAQAFARNERLYPYLAG